VLAFCIACIEFAARVARIQRKLLAGVDGKPIVRRVRIDPHVDILMSGVPATSANEQLH